MGRPHVVTSSSQRQTHKRFLTLSLRDDSIFVDSRTVCKQLATFITLRCRGWYLLSYFMAITISHLQVGAYVSLPSAVKENKRNKIF